MDFWNLVGPLLAGIVGVIAGYIGRGYLAQQRAGDLHDAIRVADDAIEKAESADLAEVRAEVRAELDIADAGPTPEDIDAMLERAEERADSDWLWLDGDDKPPTLLVLALAASMVASPMLAHSQEPMTPEATEPALELCDVALTQCRDEVRKLYRASALNEGAAKMAQIGHQACVSKLAKREDLINVEVQAQPIRVEVPALEWLNVVAYIAGGLVVGAATGLVVGIAIAR